MRSFLLFFCSTLLIHLSLADEQIPTGKKANCDLISIAGNHLGKIKLDEVKIGSVLAVSIAAELNGIKLADGAKGFHIHQFGLTSNNCKDAGPHFNPHNMQHGSPLDHSNRHVGDLGNVHCIDQSAKINILDSRLVLTNKDTDPLGIIGRAIVLHEKEDDLGKGSASDSKQTGAAGGRHACCIINQD